jgi:hypothetical protein
MTHENITLKEDQGIHVLSINRPKKIKRTK